MDGIRKKCKSQFVNAHARIRTEEKFELARLSNETHRFIKTYVAQGNATNQSFSHARYNATNAWLNNTKFMQASAQTNQTRSGHGNPRVLHQIHHVHTLKNIFAQKFLMNIPMASSFNIQHGSRLRFG